MRRNYFREYLALGYCVIPQKGQRPLVEYKKFFKEIPDENHWDEFANSADIGLICGEISNVVALDFDEDTDGLHGKIDKLLQEYNCMSPISKVGSKGKTLFYTYNGKPTQSFAVGDKVVLEFLSDKKLTTLPPSIHPKTGKPYVWSGQDIIETESLPELDEKCWQKICELFKERDAKVFGGVQKKQYIDTRTDVLDAGQIEELVNKIPNSNLPYDEFIEVGMSIKSALGDSGFNIWDNWASSSSKYKSNDMLHKWRSFSISGGISAGTLIHKAGGLPKVSKSPVGKSKNLVIPAAQKAPAKVESVAPRKSGDKIIDHISDWIISAAPYPHRPLADAAALALTGMLLGQKYKTRTNFRPNYYMVAMAESASGKDFPAKAIMKLAHKVDMGHHRCGTVSSGSALNEALEEAQGNLMLIQDEYGRVLQGQNGKNAASWQREIATNLMILFSSAGGKYMGVRYAQNKKRPRTEVDNPIVNLYGTSVKENVVDGISDEDTVDGMLARFLMFESTTLRPQFNKDCGKNDEVPPQLAALIGTALANCSGYNNTEVAQYSGRSHEMLDNLREECDEKLRSGRALSKAQRAILGRFCEKTEKLCLAYGWGKSGEVIIDEQVVARAIAAVEASDNIMHSCLQNIGKKEEHLIEDKVLELVKKAGGEGMTKANILKGSRALVSVKHRNDVLASLVEKNLVELKNLRYYA